MRDWLLRILRVIALVNAFGQLAISQIHISAITKVFINEIGFYLFFFIIFCLLTGFNTFLAENRRGIVFLILANWVTAVAGYIYVDILQTDVANQQSLAFADIQLSWTLAVVAIAICLVNSIAIPILSWGQIKTN
ncbi:MAG: hypothetical protein Phog2KO_33920 [Phototrophicaceae bacterium]